MVFLEDSSLTVDEGGEKTEVLGGQLSTPHAGSFSVEAFDEIVNLLLSDGCLDGLGVVLEDPHQAFLNILSIDIFGVLEEEIDPPGQVELVLFVAHNDLLK